jgi:hypothetical protein
LLEASPDAVLVVDEGGRIVLVNEQTEDLLGFSRAEIVGKSVEAVLPKRLHHSHPWRRATILDEPRSGSPVRMLDLMVRRKNGDEFPVEVSIRRGVRTLGNLIVSTLRDNARHRQIENGLTGILESSLNEIYIFDARSLRFVQVNEGARRNLGYSMGELCELTPLDLKPEFTIESFEQLLLPLRSAQHDKIIFHTVHKRKDGSTYPVEVHLQQMQLGLQVAFVAIILDITERKRAHDALRESHDRLEQRVEQRTIGLQEARREAERASRTKSRFLAAASHDLRQPLQSAVLYLSVLTKQVDQPRQREICIKLGQTLNIMVELLDTLLDISRLESGSVVPVKRDFYLDTLLERIVMNNLSQAQEKGLQLECGSTGLVVHSDPRLLERVIENFVTNAIRYTEHGKISIVCQQYEDSVRIAVSDTGIGIDRGDLEKVFEEYFQLENQSRDRRKGLGLGLSIVKHIARLLEHQVDVASTPGRGSTFAVYVTPGESELVSNKLPAGGGVLFHDERQPVVLLVDDNADIVDASTMLLESAGAHVYSALNSEQALACIDAGVHPDILICDYRLVGGNGVETVRRVRDVAGREIPSVILTGDTTFRKIGADELSNCSVLHKPVDTERLVSLVWSLSCPRTCGS